ncbi:MAG: hypothetical protein AAFY45_23795 [Bacteroidota bacterium]
MQKALSYLLFLALFISCQETEKKTIYHYTIEPVEENGTHALSVSLVLEADEFGIVRLNFQDNRWGEDSLYRTLSDLKTIPPALELKAKPDSNMIFIRHEPKQKFTFTYKSIQDKGGAIMNHHTYRPIIQETYFHTFGNRLFIYPYGSFDFDSSEVNFSFDWNVPEDYLIHNSFGTEKCQHLSLTQAELGSSIFVGGDFRRYTHVVNGNNIHFVTRGDWIPFEEDEVNDVLNIAIRSHKEFWQDYTDSMFSVTMIPTNEKRGYSLGGTGLSQSFATFVSNNEYVEFWRIKYLYFHELLHNWIGHKIENRDEELQYWFSEGFTDYYTYKLMFRNGVIDLEEYVKLINEEVLRPHYGSPVREARNDSITYEKFWSDRNYEKLPYRRGMIYAFHLDNIIKQRYEDKSLDDMMREILDRCHRLGDAKFDHNLFKDLLDKYLGTNAMKAFEKYIVRGKVIDLKISIPKGIKHNTKRGIPVLSISDPEKIEKFLVR